jgi:hypothetical protein
MKVALYIYTETNENVSSVVASDFRTRVLADGGTFEAQTCVIDTVQELGGVFSNIETAKRIELFEDEKISVTSSIQNVNDISKVFTDYSQSFTIPASDNNNEIFRHWYENSLDDAFDQRRRYSGYIEIDTQTFRSGKWQLESATVKNNRVEDYKITFYGELKSLTDKFGEDKLKNLSTINDYTINYTGANVETLVESTSAEDVMFPLISSSRVWQYGGGGAQDISLTGGNINYTELFPAIKVARIFDAIQDRYNVNFNGTFLNQSRFTSAYLWLKNKETFTNLSTPKLVQFTSISNVTSSGTINTNGFTLTPVYDDITNYENTTLLITLSVSTTWNVIFYKDGVQLSNQTGTGTGIALLVGSIAGDYQIYLSTTAACTYTGTLQILEYVYDPNTNEGEFVGSNANVIGGSLANDLDLTQHTPDMKVSDFFSGILKMFNLTAFSEDGTNYTLEQLENWYYQGQIRDYSEYCITDFNYDRIKPYKKVVFSYEKSESVLNRAFYDNAAREYGDLEYPFNSDGADYTIKLPFEDLLFNRFTGTQLQVGYSLNKDLQPYIPKPIILYRTGASVCSFYLNNGTTTNNITNYNVFGQEVYYENDLHSLNWGYEISSYFNEIVANSLFSDYYLNYLSNLYSLKSRMVKVKMRLPYLELLNLKLNDRIIIRDKRYIINQFTTDLITFESDFELIQDFRSVNFNNGRVQTTDNTLKTLRFDTTSVEPLTWTTESDPDGLITSLTNGDTYVDVVVKDNVGPERTAAITSNLGDRIIIIQDA